MITARSGILLSNGVFLQDGNYVKVVYIDGSIDMGKIEYFTYDNKGMLLITEVKGYKEDIDIDFANEYIKDIQLAE